jgi:hypothetical protein
LVVVVAVIVMAGSSVGMVHAVVPFTQVLVVVVEVASKGVTEVWRKSTHYLQAGTRIAAVIYGDGRQGSLLGWAGAHLFGLSPPHSAQASLLRWWW